jgi:plastocyanin
VNHCVDLWEQTSKTMAHATNTLGIKVGDVVSFTNKVGYKVTFIVTRVEEKSYWSSKGVEFGSNRGSYGTLNEYAKLFPDFKITRN